MRVKVCPVCPMCRAPHDREVDPGTKVTCPDCDQVYRAEAPEPSDPVARPRDRSPNAKIAARAEEPSPVEKKKKAPRKKGDKLGKLIERYTPSGNRAALLAIGIGAAVIGFIVCIIALVGVDRAARPYVLGGGGVLFLTTLVCLLMMQFGGSSAFFDVHKKGVRYKTRRTDQYLYWEEMETIDIRREIQGPDTRDAGKVKYEIYLIGSVTIHLTSAFMASLDDPTGLIKALKRHSGKDFDVVVG